MNTLKNTLKLTSISTMLVLALVACGSGSDSNTNANNSTTKNTDNGVDAKDKKTSPPKDKKTSPPNANEKPINMVFFNYNIDNFSNKEGYVERSNVTVNTGNIKTETLTLYGTNDSIVDTSTEYYLGDGFSSIKTDSNDFKKDIVVNDELSFQNLWKNSNDSTINTETVTYIPVDISGKTGVENYSKLGFTTILNILPLTKNVANIFPKDSKCYVIAQSVIKPYFKFDSTIQSGEKSLQAWAEFSAGGMKNATEMMVGKNNDISAIYRNDAYSDASKENDILKYKHPAAVLYQNNVYNAEYVDKFKFVPNTNIDSGYVHCQSYNKVAADFIEKQVKNAYN